MSPKAGGKSNNRPSFRCAEGWWICLGAPRLGFPHPEQPAVSSRREAGDREQRKACGDDPRPLLRDALRGESVLSTCAVPDPSPWNRTPRHRSHGPRLHSRLGWSSDSPPVQTGGGSGLKGLLRKEYEGVETIFLR